MILEEYNKSTFGVRRLCLSHLNLARVFIGVDKFNEKFEKFGRRRRSSWNTIHPIWGVFFINARKILLIFINFFFSIADIAQISKNVRSTFVGEVLMKYSTTKCVYWNSRSLKNSINQQHIKNGTLIWKKRYNSRVEMEMFFIEMYFYNVPIFRCEMFLCKSTVCKKYGSDMK